MPIGGATADSSLSIQQDSLLDFKNSVLSNVAAIISTNGSWSITSDGVLAAVKVEAKDVWADTYTVVQNDKSASTDEGVIPAGYDAKVIYNPAMKPNARVFVSFLDNPGSADWVAERGEGNFTIHLAHPALNDLPFVYWILPVDDQRTTETAQPSENIVEPTPPVDSSTTTEAVNPPSDPVQDQGASASNTAEISENP